jgi:hypothetical protein
MSNITVPKSQACSKPPRGATPGTQRTVSCRPSTFAPAGGAPARHPDVVGELKAYFNRDKEDGDDADEPKRDQHFRSRVTPMDIKDAVALVAYRLHPKRRFNETAGGLGRIGAEILLRRLQVPLETIPSLEANVRGHGARDESRLFAHCGYTISAARDDSAPQSFRLTKDEAKPIDQLTAKLHLPREHALLVSLMVVLTQVPLIDGDTRRLHEGRVRAFLTYVHKRAEDAKRWHAQALARPAPSPYTSGLDDLFTDAGTAVTDTLPMPTRNSGATRTRERAVLAR